MLFYPSEREKGKKGRKEGREKGRKEEGREGVGKTCAGFK